MAEESSGGADATSDALRMPSSGVARLRDDDFGALDRRFEEFKHEAQRCLALLERIRAAQTARLLRVALR